MSRIRSGAGWWGQVELTTGEARRWRVGPFHLWMRRAADEWWLRWKRETDPLDTSLETAVAVGLDDIPDGHSGEEELRIASGRGGGSLALVPLLADRDVVVRPHTPLTILPEKEVTFYVSSPLWLAVEIAQTSQRVLDTPLHRPSDTWFGPSTLSGTLCYAMRTHARTDLAALPRRPHRAVSPVRVVNAGAEPLRVERISVPVRHLSLFEDRAGQLWSQELSVVLPEDSQAPVEVEVSPGVPSSAAGAVPRSGAREPLEGGGIVRAISGLLQASWGTE